MDDAAKGVNLNKNRKIWLNYLIGAIVSAILIGSIYLQVKTQVEKIDVTTWIQNGLNYYLPIALLMMPLNLSIEIYKWRLLAGAAQPISVKESIKSFFAGLALSFITPNRIGEYPGRIIYLKQKKTIRLISVAALGVFSQFFALFLFGIIGLIYYNFQFPGSWQKFVLLGALSLLIFISLMFFYFEKWAKYFDHLPRFRRYNTYGTLLKRFTRKKQFTVLGLSVLRFLVYTSQYLILLRWMNIHLSPQEGYFTAFLFFWAIAVIPSIALAEIGVRGQLSLFLFGNFSNDSMGILAATFGLWCMNIIIPAIIGSFLLIRLRLIK